MSWSHRRGGSATASSCWSSATTARTTSAASAACTRRTSASFLVGNHDAHGKNYSLLYLPDPPRTILSPAYDILSTVVYPGLSRKMAMSIGGEYRPDYVQPRHLDRLLDQAGLGPAAAKRCIRGMAAAAPAAAHQARHDLADEGWDAPVLTRVVETVERRAARLLEIAAPAGRAPSR